MFIRHILSSGLNCEFICREHGFPINSNISFLISCDKPILTLKISIKVFCRLRYFADFDIKVVLLCQYSASEYPYVKLSVVYFKPISKF